MTGKMKPSRIAWIGDIPQDWNIKRVKYLASLKGRIGWQGLTSDEYIDEGPYLITGVDFQNGGIDWSNCVHISEERWAEAPEIHIQNGDLLITKDGTVGKVAIVSGLEGKASLNSGVLLIRTHSDFDKRFLFWVLQSDEFWTWFRLKNAGNSTIIHLYQGDFAEFSYTFPNVMEQCAIADFLDAQCSKIDSVISDIEKQIETLKQYMQSLIYETTVGGLKKEVTKRASDIDWINICIPEQWKTKKIRYLFQLRDERNYRPLEEVNLISLYTDLGVVQHSDLETTTGNKAYTADGYKKVYKDDIVVNIILCWMGAIGISDYEGVTSPAYDVYLPIDKKTVYPRYYHYLFKSERFHGKCYTVGRGIMAMRWRTYSSEFKNIDVPLPTYDEQVEIATFLDKKCKEIDAIIQTKQSQRDIIAQHKKALIYEYVTGKKRVTEVN